MADWTDPPWPQLTAGKAWTDEKAAASFENPISITEGAPGSPYEFSTWRPYNSLINGDGNTGAFYDHAVQGAVSQITSPVFELGWDYRFVLDDLLNLIVRMSLNNGDWRNTIDLTTGSSASYVNGVLDLLNPMRGRRYSEVIGYVYRDDIGGENAWGGVASVGAYRMRNTAKPPVSQVRFSSPQNFTGGRALMFRRRCVF
ncbi:hypothetical protein [Pseudogemmobacter humi]|uniref:Uncharacterized protein n=1 Tax=Pseudogemmobacter humi TaxID=2483812 RepID=A0A3P5XA52_9RHOB|nr:hypothetical protein [Pseudogemmobacter humi]VDC31432.1 hypothetical protein XINFAN_02889 [Pseudogemmobacter humi]